MLNRIGDYVWEATPEEVAEVEVANAQAEHNYWQNVPYDEAVVYEIRKRYTLNQELAIQRQRDEKPEEFTAYFAYCEECKAFVKAKKAET